MPGIFRDLAQRAAAAAGWPGFDPDACLVNRYVPGARMGAHRDADERDFSQPIVSVTLGAAAVFFWYGARRAGTTLRVMCWCGAALRAAATTAWDRRSSPRARRATCGAPPPAVP